jgi:hypothetical protein
MNKIPIARLWHKKGKLEYHTMLQLYKYFPDFEFEYHIVLDQYNFKDEWSEKIDNLPVRCFWYSKENMHQYLKNSGYGNDNLIAKIPNFVHFYHILINHYIRRIYNYDYSLMIEYDVIFNDKDLTQLKDFLANQIPFGIVEPANPGCDKALSQQLSQIFEQNIVRYPNIGINAGFKGLNLKIFDEFLNPSTFNILLNIFDFSGIYNEDKSEKTGWTRTIIDTQEQSFHSLMNALSPDYQLLDFNQYYVFPYWVDMDHLMKSKVIHFIGHEKPQKMMDIINLKLKEWE